MTWKDLIELIEKKRNLEMEAEIYNEFENVTLNIKLSSDKDNIIEC